ANTVFISMGWDFEQRKEVLSGMFERNHRQPLIRCAVKPRPSGRGGCQQGMRKRLQFKLSKGL
ncbi:hypothetical protein ACE2MO_005082, partial [Salmonella enterica]